MASTRPHPIVLLWTEEKEERGLGCLSFTIFFPSSSCNFMLILFLFWIHSFV
uniref:Uncharacterized protein n=1 Tax=Lotus japonicus TaxID=34305 RepID=I3S352_LOTJA|nr:unknown [Lotus japonicus]